jgi:hypothetical protein
MIINLTPHAIDVYGPEVATPVADGQRPTLSIAPEPVPARIDEVVVDEGGLAPRTGAEAVPVIFVEYGHVTGLPPVRPKTWYVVSLPVALALPGRRDLLVPYRQVRNAAGTVVGCRGLARPMPVG